MFYIGIDVAKFDYYARVADSDREVFVKPFYFTNNHGGFSFLLEKIEPYIKKRHIAGLESTILNCFFIRLHDSCFQCTLIHFSKILRNFYNIFDFLLT